MKQANCTIDDCDQGHCIDCGCHIGVYSNPAARCDHCMEFPPEVINYHPQEFLPQYPEYIPGCSNVTHNENDCPHSDLQMIEWCLTCLTEKHKQIRAEHLRLIDITRSSDSLIAHIKQLRKLEAELYFTLKAIQNPPRGTTGNDGPTY